MVIFDFMYMYVYVLCEFECYVLFVMCGSYVIVMDIIMEYLFELMFDGKLYGCGNNLVMVICEFFVCDDCFEVDYDIEDCVFMMLLLGGFLK